MPETPRITWPTPPQPRPMSHLRLADDLRSVLEHDLAAPEHVSGLDSDELDSRVSTFQNAAFLFDGARLGTGGLIVGGEPEKVGSLLARYAAEQSRRGQRLLA